MSKILILFFCLVNLKAFSTINSVSGRGINTSLTTKNSEFQKNFLFVKYATGFPKDLSLTNLKIFKILLINRFV